MTIFTSHLPRLPLVHQGKVRDIYQLEENYLLVVTTDRISAFDTILPTPIPRKGQVLKELTHFWMHFLKDIIPNQLVSNSNISLSHYLSSEEMDQVKHHSTIVHKLTPFSIECIVRGYLFGSLWNSYLNKGNIGDTRLPMHMQKADKLPKPLFTPSSKAKNGLHDENISYQEVCQLVGKKTASELHNYSLSLYKRAYSYAIERGIIIADTKFEFGYDQKGNIYLIDEALTPDSSRFWSLDTWKPGRNPKSFDKQYVRDYLIQSGWTPDQAPPELPDAVVKNTTQKYKEVQKKLEHMQ